MGKREHLDHRRMQALAEFRYALRQFLQFSEQRAMAAELQPQQHQLLLQIAGCPDDTETTVSYAAERLGLRHHSVVELSKRCEDAGLIYREQSNVDRRAVVLRLTKAGERIIRSLSEDHERELSVRLPALMRSLADIRRRSVRTDATVREDDGKQ